jgi:AmmeMemoRadiSam system protein A
VSDVSAGSSAVVAGPADYARVCVHRLVARHDAPPPPEHPFYARRAACFVTLKKYGELRGCIGTLEPAEADLGREIARNAHSAAFHDPRFPPVGEDELEVLVCSVDVLSPSEECDLADLDPAMYGVIVSWGPRRGVLLPDLGGVDTVGQQVGIALQKAGILPEEPFRVQRFTVTRFREGDAPSSNMHDTRPFEAAGDAHGDEADD